MLDKPTASISAKVLAELGGNSGFILQEKSKDGRT